MQSQSNSFLLHVEALLREPLRIARDAAAHGQRVVGYISSGVPTELILAANALPVRLRAAGDAPTPHADEYLESSFVPDARAVVEQWISGALDFMDAVIFTRNEDSSQRLYYYLCELQRTRRCGGPKPILYDIATIARATSIGHTEQSTRTLARNLGASESAIKSAAQFVAVRTALVNEMQSRNVLGSLAHRIARASEFDWRMDFDNALRTWLASAQSTLAAPRIVLAGSPPPDDRLHRFVEDAGGTIVGELTEMTAPHVAESVVADHDDLKQLALRYYRIATPAQRMLKTKMWVADEVQARGAHGAILWLIEEDEALPWEAPAQAQALRDAKIPVLVLARQNWRAGADTRQAIQAFVRTLRGGA